MDLEHLTKHQIILLTLLVSFVTSIATGIVTVSLMNQAPAGVTRTINQIVEHTVQTVVPSTSGPIVTTQKTVVVKDDDLVAQSIGNLQKSIVRITVKGSDELLARGVIVDSKGTALTDKAALLDSGADSFEAILSNGDRVAAVLEKSTGTSSPIAALLLAVGTSTGFAPAPLADSSKLKLGQSVIGISGEGVDSVGEGVIAMLPSAQSGRIEASVPSKVPGSVLATLFGEVIGITTADSALAGSGFYTLATVPPAETKPTSKP